MKLTLLSTAACVAALTFSACNGNNEKSASTKSEPAAQALTTEANTSGTSEKAPSAISPIVTHYLHIKDGLAADNGNDAAAGASALVAEMGKIDVSGFNAGQKKAYDDVSADMKEMADHISASAGKIDHQREHFVMLSDDVYALVKAFGYNTALYVDHCPMANDNKGADWISAQEAISNPYMGKKMPKCGKIKETIK